MESNSGTSTVSEPLIPLRNVWYMLIYAWGLTKFKDLGNFDTETSPDLLSLLAKILVESTNKLIRNQLGREYTNTISKVNGVRGRIRFSDSLQHIGKKESTLVCEFNELSVDSHKNRIIRSTLNGLLQDELIWSHSRSLIPQIRSVVRQMEGVGIVQLSNVDFIRVSGNRNHHNYVLPLRICALIHQLRMPMESSGDVTLSKLIHEKLPFLFEEFVRNFYKYHISEDYVVGSKILHWPNNSQSDYIPQMRTDISINAKHSPYKRLIIDTKFYPNALSDYFETRRFRSDNLYQIYAYLRSQEELGPAFQKAVGLLLYPTAGYELDEKIHIQGHDIKVATINLAAPWRDIETRLFSFL